MPKDYAALPRHELRRKDRGKEAPWIKAMLQTAPHAALATVHDGQPFINTNLFVYDETRHCIYMHTAHVGRTAANVEAGAGQPVCFSVSTMGRLLPADEALEFSVEYTGVVVFGRGHLIDDVVEQRHGLQTLLDKYAPHLRPGEHYRPITDDELKRTAVFRIDIEDWSGKKKEVSDDFPGAYLYGEHVDEKREP